MISNIKKTNQALFFIRKSIKLRITVYLLFYINFPYLSISSQDIELSNQEIIFIYILQCNTGSFSNSMQRIFRHMKLNTYTIGKTFAQTSQ